MPGQLTSRRATLDDAQALFEWRNDAIARAQSRRRAPITWPEHLTWLRTALADHGRMLVMIEEQDRPIATARWDRLSDSEWEVSITVSPGDRGRGVGGESLQLAEATLARARRDCVAVASVHRSNDPSMRLFRAAGYRLSGDIDLDGFYILRKHLSSDESATHAVP